MLKNRKESKDCRYGNVIRLADLIQRFAEMRYEKDFFDDNCNISSKHQDELDKMMKELRLFDITEVGDLYLTSGNRIVLDKGYGEYFNDSDKTLFTLKELHSGIPYSKFKAKLDEMKLNEK